MSYPKQDSVAKRLQQQNIRALNKKAAKDKQDIMTLWAQASRLLKADIAAAYSASIGLNGRWELSNFHGSGTYHQLAQRASYILSDFLRKSTAKMRRSFGEMRGESRRRHLWLIEQVTPESKKLSKTIATRNMREAAVPLTVGFEQRWGEWVDGYHSALLKNLRLNALNNGTLSDAIDEVDATRVNTPGYTLDSALDRLYEYYSWEAMAGGMHQAVEDAGDDVEEEIWRTSGDLRVCDDCDSNEGLTPEEADGTIPLHPNCNCFYQLVPATFAALLRSGDEADRQLALDMDAEGIAPNALVIRAEDGSIAAKTIVDFEKWDEANSMAIGGR